MRCQIPKKTNSKFQKGKNDASMGELNPNRLKESNYESDKTNCESEKP